MLGQRRRPQANFTTTLGQRRVLVGNILIYTYIILHLKKYINMNTNLTTFHSGISFI